MKPLFVARQTDPVGSQALGILTSVGCATRLLDEAEDAGPTDIALFSNVAVQAGNLYTVFKGKCVRAAAHHLSNVAPSWTSSTPFRVAVRMHGAGDFDKSILTTAQMYETWFAGGCQGYPWGQSPTQADNQSLAEDWYARATSVIPTGATWETTTGLRPAQQNKVKPRGQGWSIKTSTVKASEVAEVPITITTQELEREAAIVALLGAFNFEVGMSMETIVLHQTYQQLVKRLALIAESAATGGGELLFRFIAGLAKEEARDREHVMPLVEALLVYGKFYGYLTPYQRAVADQFQMADEQSHFSRIMDVDAVRNGGVKRLVGAADAGNPLIVRMLMNAARYREDLGVQKYWALPHHPNPEAANYHNPKNPVQVRKGFPYVVCSISAGTESVAHDLMEIYRRLITQYPLEAVFLMMEEWLMNFGVDDTEVSFTAAQVVRHGDAFEAKIVNAGGGQVVIRAPGQPDRQITFDTKGHDNGLSELSVGHLDFQQPHHVGIFRVTAGDEIYVFPKTVHAATDARTLQNHTACLHVNAAKIEELPVFEWTEDYVQQNLADLVDQIVTLAPDRVEIQFGHVHGDRDPNDDQIVGAKIAGAFARMLTDRGISIATRPMSDNYHVIDRLNFPAWIKLLTQHSGLPITEVTFEDALISRHLGDEATALLYRTRPSDVVRQGGNYYYRPPEVAHMMVELYDGIHNPGVDRGRLGCVNFQIGYELYRLNPTWINIAYKAYIMTHYPQSLAAQWWKATPDATYQELMYRHVYLLPAELRMALKARVDAEIDRPFADKCMSGNTPLLDGLLAATVTSRVVLVHVLEGFYDAQERKSAALWQALGLPRVNQWRVSFNRHTGELKALDWNRHIE